MASTAESQEHLNTVLVVIKNVFNSQFLEIHGEDFLKLIQDVATEYTKFVIKGGKPGSGVPLILQAIKTLVKPE